MGDVLAAGRGDERGGARGSAGGSAPVRRGLPAVNRARGRCGRAGPGRPGAPEPRVRMLCCKVLDHVMDSGSIPALVAALADPVDDVRMQAVHALACDRCKSGDVRPAASEVLPVAIGLLRGTPTRGCGPWRPNSSGPGRIPTRTRRPPCRRPLAMTPRPRSGRRRRGTRRAALATSGRGGPVRCRRFRTTARHGRTRSAAARS